MTAHKPGDPTTLNRLYGRSKGKKLRTGQQGLVDTLLPRIAVPTEGEVTAERLFGRSCPLHFEIGFGGGEHIVGEAHREADTGFIGVEPFLNGMAKGLAAIEDEAVDNIRVFDRDAALLLDWLPQSVMERVDLLYPDPWPKPRHWKRRFVCDENLDRIARVLKPGGEFRFASDIDTYVDWTLTHIARRSDLVWTAARADDWRLPWPAWPGTRYEAKAFREGRPPAYLIFRRL